MSDYEYLLNPCFNPLEEMEFIQILSEIKDLHDSLKESQKLFEPKFILPHESPDIETLGGIKIFKFKSPKIPKFIICDNPEIAKIVDIYYLTPIFPTITEESSIIQISTPKS